MTKFERALDGSALRTGLARFPFLLNLALFICLCERYHYTFIVLLWDSPFKFFSTSFTQGATKTFSNAYTVQIWLEPIKRVFTFNKWRNTANNPRPFSNTVVNESQSLTESPFTARISHCALWYTRRRMRCATKSQRSDSCYNTGIYPDCNNSWIHGLSTMTVKAKSKGSYWFQVHGALGY